MLDNTDTYYIPENEDVLGFLDKNDIRLSDPSRKQLAFISQKSHNNQIGYFQFQSEERYVKFFILPKIISQEATPAEKEKAFFKFFSQYYILSNKYDEIKKQRIDGNIIDISFDDKKLAEFLSGTIDDFIRYKYEFALKILDRFFRKHNRTQVKSVSYTSQAIENKIDLKNNIRSLNKANVHQTRSELEAYSEIALITEQALKQFKIDKVEQIEHHKEVLLSKTNTILSLIKKKYSSKSYFSFKDRDIITNRIAKLFKGNSERKAVYEALLIIIGLEHFQSQDKSQEVLKLENMVALFFNPADLFEWIVYDHLKTTHPNADLQKDGLGEGTTKTYQLETGLKSIDLKSNPDFIMIETAFVSVIDAKWKVLEKIENIKFDDIAKLERDWVIRKDDYDKDVRATLIYPKIDFDYEAQNPLMLSYSSHFIFEIDKVEVGN